MNLEILTVSEDSDSPFGILNTNFRRIQDGFDFTREIDAGADTVTGTLTIPTNLSLVAAVVACLNGPPSANAAYVVADITSAASIRLRVYTSAFALSTTATVINWVALGE